MMKRIHSLYVALAFLILCATAIARAAVPMAKTQAPGFYRMMLGNFEVTALNDGVLDLDIKLFDGGANPANLALLRQQYVASPAMRTSVNAYLINTGEHLVLVDTGMSNAAVPTLGNMMSNLKASGYTPDQVDTVLITHMHGDHIGGLITADGERAFPNADVYVSKAESDYWLSKSEAAKAYAFMKYHFSTAQKIADVYITAGRWKTFDGAKSPVDGIKPLLATGHTPGHTVYRVTSAGQTLIIWGDLVHCSAVQFHTPGTAVSFDKNQKQAIASRRAIMKETSSGKALIAGMHLPFPGIGHVRADAPGVYAFVPVIYSSVVEALKPVK